MLEEKRGSFEGAIRIPLHASSFFFNDLAFLVIPRKSLKFLTPLFSIPTAPTIHLPGGWTLNKNTRGQKGAD
jgi:hypothetical protein